MDFLSLQLIGRTQINLIPLQVNAFTDGKSELKHFEAAAVGTVSIASPTATARTVITDGHNALLANAHEWDEKLMVLIDDLLLTRQTYSAIAREAHRHAVERYSWERQVPAIESVLMSQ